MAVAVVDPVVVVAVDRVMIVGTPDHNWPLTILDRLPDDVVDIVSNKLHDLDVLESTCQALDIFRRFMTLADPVVAYSPGYDRFNMGGIQILSDTSEVTVYDDKDLFFFFKSGCFTCSRKTDSLLKVTHIQTYEGDADGIGKRISEPTSPDSALATLVLLMDRFFPEVLPKNIHLSFIRANGDTEVSMLQHVRDRMQANHL